MQISVEELRKLFGLFPFLVIILYVIWLISDFLFAMFGIARHARTVDEWLAVLLLAMFVVVLSGDIIVYFLLRDTFQVNITPNAVVLIHLAPHILVSIIFLVRILWMLVGSAGAFSGKIWRRSRESIPMFIFVFGAALDAGDYIWRSINGGLFPWVPTPWPGYWIVTAVVAASSWLLAAIAVKMAVIKAEAP